MQLRTLKKIVDAAVLAGHGHKTVYVSKTSFRSPCEDDGLTILPVEAGKVRTCPIFDGDGWQKFRKNGEEAVLNIFVLTGGFEE